MSSFRLLAPYIRWGTNLANAVYLPFPLDNVVSYSEPRAGSETIQSPSGVEDAWYIGPDYLLEGDARWLQAADTLFYPRCTGWDGTLGMRAWLEDARKKNTFSLHPDGRNLLRLPNLNSAGAVTLGGQGGWATITDAGLTSPVNAFDGVETAWKFSATNGTGVSKGLYIYQDVPGIPGEQVCLSADYKASGFSGGAVGVIQVDALDASHVYISTINFTGSLTATTYTRPSPGFGSAAPANTAYLRAYCYLSLPAGAAGAIWFRNAMLRRDSSDTTFLGNGSFDGCYLVEPMGGPPSWEADGSRRLRLKIRNTAAEFNAY